METTNYSNTGERKQNKAKKTCHYLVENWMNAQDPEYLSFGSKLQKKMYVFGNVFNKDTKPQCQH